MNQNRRSFLKTLGLGSLAMVCSECASTRTMPTRANSIKPNVVIFFTDDQGTLDVNCYGSKDLYTPAMDNLAETGVRFTRAYAHTVCCPARAMLMTGRYPQRGNVNMWTQGNAKEKKGRNLFREEITMAEALKGAGYKTGLFGKWHLGAHFDHGPTEQGFDEFIGLRGGFIDNYNHYFLHGNGFHDLYEGKKEISARDKYFPDIITDRAMQFIDKNKQDPFFMYVAFNIPHYPEQPDMKFDERYKDLKMPRRSYAKMISTTDDRMGMIMDRLEQHGLRENTIVVFMSDNGHSAENYKIHGKNHTSGLAEGTNYGANGGGGNTGKWRGHKGSFFEGGIRVPAVISYPAKLPRGIVRDQAITAMDWMPTILDLCQIPLPGVELDGKSLIPVIKSKSAKSRYDVLHWQWGNRWSVLEGEWKLIGKDNKAESLGALSDPQPEKKNYINEKPDIVKRLQALHDEWLKEVQAEPEFVQMFNGKDLTGWNTTGNWVVEEGNTVTLKPRPGEHGWKRYKNYLTTDRQYGNFVLDLEFKFNAEGNSGVFMRVGDLKDHVNSGFELQILDTYGKENVGHHDCGGIIRTVGPSKNMVKPAGQWNRYTVTLIDNSLKVVLNGEQIIDLNLSESAIKDRPSKGYISFQDEAKRIWYRNVRIKELKGLQ